jgi:hypothetical protein
MTRISLIAIAFSLFLMSGCQKPEAGLAASRSKLDQRVNSYHESIFWRDYETASLLVAKRARAGFNAHAENLRRGYTLQEFFVKEIQISPSGDRAAVVVSRSFVRSASVTLQYEEVVQEWTLGGDGLWYLSGPPY